MTQRMNQILAPGRVAVITGAGSGIGAGLARELYARGMLLALVDTDHEALCRLNAEFNGEALISTSDVTSHEEFEAFYQQVSARYDSVHLLVNNVGAILRAGPWGAPDAWKRSFDVNFTSALIGQHFFVPRMISGDEPAAVVNLGSKEGITTPPGNAAYSAAKAALKVMTEQLAHELLMTTDGRVSAHLLVPGYTWTPMNGQTSADAVKPKGAWTVEQLIDYAIARLLNEDFYVICPDNEVSSELDAKRIRWSTEDMIKNRPALSRWHPDYKDRYAEWLRQ